VADGGLVEVGHPSLLGIGTDGWERSAAGRVFHFEFGRRMEEKVKSKSDSFHRRRAS
ncbi:hypothetical protein LINPERHAP2_LOCUS4772, partial [Linum perenne]